jgi:hypothetical protein
MELVLTIRVNVYACTRHGEDGVLPDAEEIRSDLTDRCIDMLHYQHKDGDEHLCVVDLAEGI